MGITAISGIQNAYAQNQRDIPSWEKAVNERGIATMRGYHLPTTIASVARSSAASSATRSS
jgi:coproporphyrinogen III oxidase-like Fe-S oxidoreductase